MTIIKREELSLSEEERENFANVHSICAEIAHHASGKLYDAAIEIMKNIEFIHQIMQSTPNDKTDYFKIRMNAVNQNEILRRYRSSKCFNCVWSNECFPVLIDTWDVASCPSDHTYKRDPPDGGYYG